MAFPAPPRNAAGQRLTRTNTQPGSPQRSLVNAYEYSSRKATGASAGLSTSQIRGHAKTARGEKGVRELKRVERPKIIDAIRQARSDPSITLDQAARRAGTTEAKVRSGAPGAVTETDGRWIVKPTDRLTRRMRILTGGQVVEVDVRGSRQASLVGRHWAAIRRYLDLADEAPLRALAGKRVSGYELECDPDEILALAQTGQLNVPSIYA